MCSSDLSSVAGVFNVIGGWFLTAGAAFVMGLITAVILFYGEIYGLITMIFLVGYLVVRNAIAYRKKQRKEKEAQKKRFNKEDLITISGIMKLSSQNIAGAVQTIDELYREVSTSDSRPSISVVTNAPTFIPASVGAQ